MNNNYNGYNSNYPNSGYQPPSYQPPNYNGYYGYQPPSYNTGYQQKPPYSEAAEKTLDSMKTGPFLIASIVFGWLCSRTLWIAETGIGMTVLGIAFYVLFMPFILSKQKKIPLSAWILLIPQALIFLSFSLYSGVGYTMLALLAALIISMFQVTLMAGCTAERPFSLKLFGDVCYTYLAYPFMNLAKTFTAVFGGRKNKSKKTGMTVASKIGIGMLVSIPVVLVLICLLSFADKMFDMWVMNFISSLNISIGRIMCDIFLTMLTMLYIMPLVVTLRSGYHQTHSKKEYKRPFDAIITTTVLFAASVIYLIFTAVQFRYLFAPAVLQGVRLPGGISYAQYCRRGFFELVFVIAVTTLVIVLTCMLTRLNDKGKLPIYTKAALLLITASDFIMIISASLRVYVYVDAYDMTVSRLNAAVLIAFMGICLVVTAIKIVFENFRISSVIGGIIVAMLALYCIFDVDGFVARYNIDRYLENPAAYEIDMSYLSELSVSAIPEIERLMENSSDSEVKLNSRRVIARIANRADLFDGDNNHLGRWSLDRQRAVNVLEKRNITYSDYKSWLIFYRNSNNYEYD